MRRIIASAILSLAALPAFAADMAGPAPVLRGALPSEQQVDFSGFYAGVLSSYNTSSNASSGTGLDPNLQRLIGGYVIEPSIRSLPLVEIGRSQRGRTGFGVFGGYNYMIEDMIVGAELDYTKVQLDGGSFGSRSGRHYESASDTTYDWTVSASKDFKITDIGSLRGRVGYALGNFMPHVSAGIAVARASANGDATVASTQFTTLAPVPVPNTYTPSSIASGQRAKFYYGYALGAGVDYLLTNNIMVRAELQHQRFSNIGGFTVQINTARVGAAIKY